MAQEQQGAPLSDAEKLKIDEAFARLAECDFYQLLGVERGVDKAGVKRAYYTVSKEFHPDRYFRRPLGNYKEKLETLFDLITKAYNTLSDAEGRLTYDREHPPAPPRPQAPPPRASSHPARAQEALAGRSDRDEAPGPRPLVPRVPMPVGAPPPKPMFLASLEKQLAEKTKKARNYLEMAKEAMEKKDYQGASGAAQMALTFDPGLKEATRIMDESSGALADSRAETYYNRGNQEEMIGNTEAAKRSFAAAVACKPRKGHYYYRYAQMLKDPAVLREKLDVLRNAVLYDGTNREYILALAEAYEAVGMPRNALREFEKVLKADSSHDAAGKAVKRLKALIS